MPPRAGLRVGGPTQDEDETVSVRRQRTAPPTVSSGADRGPTETDGSGTGSAGARTAGSDYSRRLQRLEGARWKQLVDVQAPYRWRLRRLRLGRTLDVGCGLGRNLAHLGAAGVGVDHNATSVAVARSRGLRAWTSGEFPGSGDAAPGAYDALLLAHVVEHMGEADAEELLRAYLPYLRSGGRVVLVTPQEKGFASDDTHVRFVDLQGLDRLSRALGLVPVSRSSFPLPRTWGRVFTYNEFWHVSRRSGAAGTGGTR